MPKRKWKYTTNSAAQRDVQFELLRTARLLAKKIKGTLIAKLGKTEAKILGVGIHPNHQEVQFLTRDAHGYGQWTRPSGAEFHFVVRDNGGSDILHLRMK